MPSVEIHPKHKKPVKLIEIVLTLFYGQFIANAIYENLIRGVPELIRESTSYFNIFRVVFGVVIIIVAIYSIFVIWLKKYQLMIFISAILLTIVFLISLVVSIIDLVQRKERNISTEKDTPVLATILAVESIFRIIAIILTFLLVKILRQNYELINTNI
jgi:hypothetical protein